MKNCIRLLLALLFGVLIVVSSGGALTDGDLEQIQEAIREQGARWEARDNPVFRLSPEELKRLCGANMDAPAAAGHDLGAFRGLPQKLPSQFDWRNKEGVNYLTPIRNQAGCGSCVAFGTIAAFEGLINIYCQSPSQDLDLSEQHIFSCGGGSCDFGWSVPSAAQYLQDYGAPPETCLPYTAVDDNCEETCTDWQEQVRKIMEWDAIPLVTSQWTVEQIKIRILFGPVMGVFQVYEDFGAYHSGVYRYVWGDYLAGHCIAIVGWNDADSSWICKNSWGSYWGEDGYFRIRMGHNEVGIEESVHWMIPEDGYLACVQMTEVHIDDGPGNGDGMPDGGETLDLRVTLENRPTWATLTDAAGWLLSTDPRGTVVDAMAMYSSPLPGGGSITNDDDPYTIVVAEEPGLMPLSFTLFVTGACGTHPYASELYFQLPLVVPHRGWPAQTTAGVRCSPLMVWNHRGTRDLVAIEDGAALHRWDESGQEVAGFPFQAPGGAVWGSPAMADLDGDGREEILFGSQNDTLYALRLDGSVWFKRDLGADILATPAVADLDADGSWEIVLGTKGQQLFVLTNGGQDRAPFPISVGGAIMADAALADLDQDGYLDVAVGATDGFLYVLCGNTGQNLPGFPFATGGPILSSPAIADLGSNGEKEIIVGSDDRKLYALTSSATVLFTCLTEGSIKSSPAIADLDGDGGLDVIFTSQDNKVYAANQQGQLLTGWPYDVGKVLWSSPIVLDVDGDGALEVVVEVPGMDLLHLEADGSLMLNVPVQSGGIAMSTPVAGDLDNDGHLEIAVGAPKGVHTWHYPTASSVDMPWPMHRGNARRTGHLGDNVTGRAERPGPSAMPGQFVLWQNYPNPFNAETTIRYSLAQDLGVTLTVYNVIGQRIITLVDDHQQAGQHSVSWDGIDAGRKSVSSGLYFYRLQAGDFVSVKKMVFLR